MNTEQTLGLILREVRSFKSKQDFVALLGAQAIEPKALMHHAEQQQIAGEALNESPHYRLWPVHHEDTTTYFMEWPKAGNLL